MPEAPPSGIPQGEGGGVCGTAGSSDAATAVPTLRTRAMPLRESLPRSVQHLTPQHRARLSAPRPYGTAGRTPAHTAESSGSRCVSSEIGLVSRRACYGAPAQSPSLWCQRLLRVESRRAREEESVAPRARAMPLRLSRRRVRQRSRSNPERPVSLVEVGAVSYTAASRRSE